MRRTTGAILIETRPERISRSAWRGEARNASPPKRATSTRAPTIDIISIAQQASPNVAGKIALARGPAAALSSVVGEQALLDVLLERLALQLAAQHLARRSWRDAELPRRGRLARYLHSSAPLRHTYTKATVSRTMKTIVSTSAKVPNASSWIATG